MENQIGLLRLPEVLKLIPVSKSTWWAGVKKGIFPASKKLSARVTVWRREDILSLVKKIGEVNGDVEQK